MQDLNFEQMMRMQRELQALHAGEWDTLTPEVGRSQLLWMVEEVGEVIAIFKKKGAQAIMEDPAVRAAFLEEMGDVIMYFTDVLLCMGVAPEEFAAAYVHKHDYNMQRDYRAQNRALYQGQAEDA
ncbi:MAG: nucleotide pyrophosphohydrolase [Christensenellales bacterium]|jgi:NTP pyrophosphatase (non-canonical NTP hydrolase)